MRAIRCVGIPSKTGKKALTRHRLLSVGGSSSNHWDGGVVSVAEEDCTTLEVSDMGASCKDNGV